MEYLELNNVPINGSCREVVMEWKWLKKDLKNSNTPNAIKFRDSTLIYCFMKNIKNSMQFKLQT